MQYRAWLGTAEIHYQPRSVHGLGRSEAQLSSARFRPVVTFQSGLINKWAGLGSSDRKPEALLGSARIYLTNSWARICQKKFEKIRKSNRKVWPGLILPGPIDKIDGLEPEMLQPGLSSVRPALRWAGPRHASARPMNTLFREHVEKFGRQWLIQISFVNVINVGPTWVSI